MELKNKIMLITYADSMGNDLKDLEGILNTHFSGVVGGLHILPFFPSSADRGFAPTTYNQIDPAFGDWEDIRRLSENYYLMFDFMINHISRRSAYFEDYLAKGDASEYKDLFINYQDFWPEGRPTEQDIDLIYKRKPRAPYVELAFGDGKSRKIWCTFDEEQIDLNCNHPLAKKWIAEQLTNLAANGAALLRLDAFAYATKKLNTNCFFVEPDVWQLLKECEDILRPLGCQILPEIHEHYSMQLRVTEHGYYVYDFSLPMLLLHALYTGKNQRLLHWLRICPRKQFTTLDTHDGIGVVDARGLMSDEEIELTKEKLYSLGGTVKKIYSTTAYNNLDIYQINCTYYSALGEDHDAYLLARVIQFFAPGIPQVYYVGLMAGANDVQLVEKTRIGRDINRHYYTAEEIEQELQRPVLKKMYKLMRLRNSHPAFDGQVEIDGESDRGRVIILWNNGSDSAKLVADLLAKTFTVTYTGEWDGMKELAL